MMTAIGLNHLRFFFLLSLCGLVTVQTGCHSKKDSKGAHASASAPVQVTARLVQRRDVPMYRTGLGTAQATYTARVHPQVAGRLDAVLFVEGQKVRRGEPLAQLDERPYRMACKLAEANLARDQAQLKNSEVNLERNHALLKQELVSAQTFTDMQATVAQLAATVAGDLASLAAAKLQLDYTTLLAPIEGRVGIRLIDPGNLVNPGDGNALVVITKTDPMAVIVSLPQDDLPQVLQAMAHGPVIVEALARDEDRVLAQGNLLLIDNQIDVGTGTIRLKAELKNPNEQIWPNQFVRARILLSVHKDALVVPAEALSRSARGEVVWVVGADGTASPRPVSVGQIFHDTAIITQGLLPGDRVICEGHHRLRVGSKVEILADKSTQSSDQAPEAEEADSDEPSP